MLSENMILGMVGGIIMEAASHTHMHYLHMLNMFEHRCTSCTCPNSHGTPLYPWNCTAQLALSKTPSWPIRSVVSAPAESLGGSPPHRQIRFQPIGLPPEFPSRFKCGWSGCIQLHAVRSASGNLSLVVPRHLWTALWNQLEDVDVPLASAAWWPPWTLQTWKNCCIASSI